MNNWVDVTRVAQGSPKTERLKTQTMDDVFYLGSQTYFACYTDITQEEFNVIL